MSHRQGRAHHHPVIASLIKAVVQATPQQIAGRRAIEIVVDVQVNVGGGVRSPELHAGGIGVARGNEFAQAPGSRSAIAHTSCPPTSLVVIHDSATRVVVLPVVYE
jgi:hypothetical protein